MNDKVSDQNNTENDPEQTFPSSSIQSERRNEKNPYLTAYIGFIALFVLSGIAAWLIFSVPLFIYSSIVRGAGRSPFTELFIFVFQMIFGYYAFKHVIKKHVLLSNNK